MMNNTRPSFYLISSAVDGNVNAIEKILALYDPVVVKHFCNTLFENSPGISSFKWCFPIIVGMRTDMIVPYVHISV